MSSLRLLVVSLPFASLALLAGCGPVECFRAIRCVESCGGPVLQSGCSPCPAGTFDDLVCRGDAGPDSGGRDAAAADAPAASLPFHLIRHDCGPADGPALHVGLYTSVDPACGGDPLLPSITLYVYPTGSVTFPPAAGTVITSTAAAPSGMVSACPGGTPPCRTSQDFTVTFDAYADGVDATGTYEATFTDGSTERGSFEAMWCERTPVTCG